MFQFQVIYVEACDGTFKHQDVSPLCRDLSLLKNDCKRAFKLNNKILFKIELKQSTS